MAKKKSNWIYSPHYCKEETKGHIFMPLAKNGNCITLIGTASMSQKDIDRLGSIIVKSVNKLK